MRARVLASKLLHFVSLTDSFIMLDVKLLKPRSLMLTATAHRSPQLSGLSRNGPMYRRAYFKIGKISHRFFSYVLWNI